MRTPQVNTISSASAFVCLLRPACCVVLLPEFSNALNLSFPHAGKRNPIMVKMVPMDDHLLLQWMAPKSFKEPRLLDLNVNDYVDTPSDTAGDGVTRLSAIVSRSCLSCSHCSLILFAQVSDLGELVILAQCKDVPQGLLPICSACRWLS